MQRGIRRFREHPFDGRGLDIDRHERGPAAVPPPKACILVEAPLLSQSGAAVLSLADSAAMPLNWTIDSKAKLLTVLAEGDVTRSEFEAYLDLVDEACLHTYRKLFDGVRADTSMGAENILAVGVRMRASHQTNPVGPLAVVLGFLTHENSVLSSALSVQEQGSGKLGMYDVATAQLQLR